MDDVPRRCRRRHGHGAGDLGRTGLGPARALGHGRLDHQHVPGARAPWSAWPSLGSIVNGQLTVNLVQRLTAIGIPKSFQSLVVSAVTTGTYQGQAKAATAKNHAIAHIVNEVVSAAYGAFGRGLNISLNIAGALLLASAVLALTTVYGRRIHLERVNSEEGHLLHPGRKSQPT